MIFQNVFAKIGIQLVFLVALAVQDDMCGMPAPDPAKTCISIRLPWNPQPMYFCTDKSKFRYRNQCQNRFVNQCGYNSLQHDTLMVAAPWDCCPLTSYPDSCVNQYCPPAPLNRKCQTMEPHANQPWECCNTYFCEENMTPDTCHLKRLEPTCNMAPQGKKNCVAFVDPFGCCPKFQCEGDARPGHCPAEVEAMKLMARFNTTNMMMAIPGGPMMMHPGMGMGMGVPNGNMGNMGAAGSGSPAGQTEMHIENSPPAGDGAAPPPPPPPEAPSAPEGEAPPPADRVAGGFPAHNGAFIALPQTQNQIACIGDFNCPGNMKCCSHDMNVYLQEGRYFLKNRNPTNGYCVEAVMNANMNTKTIKYVTQ